MYNTDQISETGEIQRIFTIIYNKIKISNFAGMNVVIFYARLKHWTVIYFFISYH